MLNRKQEYVLFTMGTVCVLVVAGCKAGGQKSDPLAADGYPPSLPAPTTYQGHTQFPEPAVATTPLPPVQQASTAPQEYCPVTGAKLGSMGAPIPVAIGSQTVYVCCAACIEELRQNPDQYLRTGNVISSASSGYPAQQNYAASNRTAGSSPDQAGSCGSGSCVRWAGRRAAREAAAGRAVIDVYRNPLGATLIGCYDHD